MTENWTTKEGKVLKIKDMETSHIKNCIKHLESIMPDHEEDEIICGDHWSLGCYTEAGAKHYKAKIAQFGIELSKRIS